VFTSCRHAIRYADLRSGFRKSTLISYKDVACVKSILHSRVLSVRQALT